MLITISAVFFKFFSFGYLCIAFLENYSAWRIILFLQENTGPIPLILL